MQAVRNAQFLNPSRAVQILEELKSFTTSGIGSFLRELRLSSFRRRWRLSSSHMGGGDSILPYDKAFQARRMARRFVWPKVVPDHINPGALEAGAGRIYQCVVRVSFASKRFEGSSCSLVWWRPPSGWPSTQGFFAFGRPICRDQCAHAKLRLELGSELVALHGGAMDHS